MDIRGIPAHFPILTRNNSMELTSGQEQPEENDRVFTPYEVTITLRSEKENFTQGTGNSVAWINAPDHSGSMGAITSVHYEDSWVRPRQNAKEAFSHSDLRYRSGNISGIVDAGTAARKEIT
jgi:hypothetical protein